MIIGVNRVYEHAGKEYHLQAEDLGTERASFTVRVYEGGTVLWQKKVSYQEIVGQQLPKADQDESVRSMMERTLYTVQAAIAKGKLL